MKVVINKCFGGYGLSAEAIRVYCKAKGIDPGKQIKGQEYFSNFYDGEIPRNDPDLVRIVEQLKERSWGMCAKLKVVEIPDGVKWEIRDYDGMESIHEVHRVWG